MKDIDIYAAELFEEAKRFLEKAKDAEMRTARRPFFMQPYC